MKVKFWEAESKKGGGWKKEKSDRLREEMRERWRWSGES